jgi:hypothetical protein
MYVDKIKNTFAQCVGRKHVHDLVPSDMAQAANPSHLTMN